MDGRRHRATALVIGAALALSGCGQGDGNDGGPATEVTQLDAEGVATLSSGMAACVRDTIGGDIADDFLIDQEGPAFDLSQATPEQEQALTACLAAVSAAGEEQPPTGADPARIPPVEDPAQNPTVRVQVEPSS